MKSLKIYNVLQRYYNYIRRYDDKVPHLVGDKAGRPFIGIVLEINDSLYFAPLTSPKIKHLHMRNSVDFTKIDGRGETLFFMCGTILILAKRRHFKFLENTWV